MSFLRRNRSPQGGEASATVGKEPLLVPVYNNHGKAAHVPQGQVAEWLADGWRLTSLDLGVEIANLSPRFQATQQALGVLAAGAASKGQFTPADLATAEAAVADLASALLAILSSARLGYGQAEPDPQTLCDPFGVVRKIDPGQRDHYFALGWKEVPPV